MKKLMIVGLVALVALAMLPGGAMAGKKKKKKPVHQMVDGSVLMRAPWAGDQLASCYTGGHRRVAVLSGEAVNGDIGYHFDVDPKTAGQPFELEVTGGQGDVDFDITFYTEFGTQEQATDTAYAPANIGFEERGPGGEVGEVPVGMEKAIVCMYDGYNATFTYSTGMAPAGRRS